MEDGAAIGVVTFPISYTGDHFSLNLIKVLEGIASRIILITGEVGFRHASNMPKVTAIQVLHFKGRTTSARIARYLLTQLKMALALAEHSRDVDTWVFHNGGDGLIFALLAARILGKRAILIVTGSPARISKAAGDRLSAFSLVLTHLGFLIASRIVVHSRGIVADQMLHAWAPKIVAAHEHFLDPHQFDVRILLPFRESEIGYVGRLSPEKGVMNFAEAATLILKNEAKITFSVGGVGPLDIYLREFVRRHGIEESFRILGFVPHEEMCDLLNRLKLLVLPSYTEGLPTIVVEAFATGTPVLVSPVGALPDFVEDGKTGFLLENNAPETIAERVTEILRRPDLERVSENALRIARTEFSYDSVVKRFRTILG